MKHECVVFHATKLFDHNEAFVPDRTMPVSDPDVSRLLSDFAMPAFWKPTDARSPCGGAGHNRLGFAYQGAFVRVLGRWKNVILYGEIKIDPATLKMRDPY